MQNLKYINSKKPSGYSAFTVFFNLDVEGFNPDVKVSLHAGGPTNGAEVSNLNQDEIRLVNLSLDTPKIIDLFFNECLIKDHQETPRLSPTTATVEPLIKHTPRLPTVSVAKTSKYFVLLKIMIDEFQFKTLHKGKIITIESKEAYKEFVLEMLSFKGSDYQDLQPAALIFDYFKLPEDRKAVNDEWTEIRPPAPQGDKTSKVKLDKFGKFLKENIHKHWNLRYHYSLNIISIFFILGLTFLFIKDLNLNKSCA